MDLDEAIRRRRMCRQFLDRPVHPDVVDRLIDRARRAPSAGHSQGWAFVVLEGPEQTGRFWRLDAEPSWLSSPSLPGLLRAPVIVIPLANAEAYLTRYQEPDKAPLGRSTLEGWPAPYWLLDTAMATMLLLLGAVAEGLGALLFTLHGDAEELLAELRVPSGWQPIGAVAIGWPDPASPGPPHPTVRRRRPLGEVLHRGGW